MPADSRQRMIQSAAVLIRERGVEATSFTEVIAHSGAPRGSIYHHFPGGKEQLVEEATRYAGEYLVAGLIAALATKDPRFAIRRFAEHWIGVLRDSDFGAGCPVVAATLDGSPAVRAAAGEAFAAWEGVLADAIASSVADPERAHAIASSVADAERAHAIATLAIAAIEGAVVLARAQRSIRPLERVAGELERLIPDRDATR